VRKQQADRVRYACGFSTGRRQESSKGTGDALDAQRIARCKADAPATLSPACAP
jgi:hypothetical protein